MGVVTKVGPGVSGFKEGQRLTSLGWLGHEGSGSWQQYINVPAERVVALPDGISDEAGAQFYVSRAAQQQLLLWCHSLADAGMTQTAQHRRDHKHTQNCLLSGKPPVLLCAGACAAAVALQINPVTVIGLLEVSGAKAGEHIVITAAGSTLSRMLIAAARAQGIKTIGVVRRAEAVQEVKDSTG
jgi:NADPH:quinone reductase-like Zn-dependent oxidoreductase